MTAGTRPRRVAVVGAGPAGLFAADALASQSDVDVDVVERLPTPYGLVRYGVAPDHPTIKSVVHTLQRVLDHERIRFIGGIEVGRDILRADLLECYDAVVYTTGAAIDRRLGIPGEDLPGSVSATEFVSWYNGHPDFERGLPLDAESVAVIGAGNVALDVGRILVRPREHLARTDVPASVLARWNENRTLDVHVIGRRGPEHAKFSSKELRELGLIAEVDRVVRPADLVGAHEPTADRRTRANLDLLREWSAGVPRPSARKVRFRFFRTPVEIIGRTRVEAVRLERLTVDGSGATAGTGEFETIPVQLVVRAVGYRSAALPGLPFDAAGGVIPHNGGRIVDGAGVPLPGEYVAGWAKRGATGVIGTNKSDARETVSALLDDLATTAAKRPAGQRIEDVLAAGPARWIDHEGWRRIDREELGRGAREGRARSKIPDWATLTDIALRATAERFPD
ncbi:FAD-dependent oxidoreductase [Amycolatopsis sp. FDAARGOS 1241]|uniref:FAD-dependent oxidoreductase n=1 Tax=Amycolatopsis sp. FDAARGOS 1241 TaxID=2778070 RepID=UPI0019529A96|nr:FAD-dependent oxidoreductase [Amycolatopsis sp. FDAARGOS 1241]QRP42854.1 FAD-dependent oxidoreductase [Amycolatopsis sp. FDAARGOS 1241]